MAELLKGAMIAINEIQFQKGLSLSAFIRDYGTEEQCEAAFIKARWPRGFVCPCCGHTAPSEFKRRELRYWQCGAFRHETSLRARTVMEHWPLSLTKWYLGILSSVGQSVNLWDRQELPLPQPLQQVDARLGQLSIQQRQHHAHGVNRIGGSTALTVLR
jgi:ribosomal protein L37AE/L43A